MDDELFAPPGNYFFLSILVPPIVHFWFFLSCRKEEVSEDMSSVNVSHPDAYPLYAKRKEPTL
jgi:hypothetical protein